MLSLELEESVPGVIFSLDNLAGRADWATPIINRESLVLLFVNYTFFCVIMLGFILFLLCLTHTAAPAIDMIASMTFLAVCFVMVNMVVANYLVHTMNINRELRIHF